MALTGQMADRTKGLILWTLAMVLVAIGIAWLVYLGACPRNGNTLLVGRLRRQKHEQFEA